MTYMLFNVRCGGCSYVSRPSPSPREGIRRVLSGEFTKCPSCKAEFAKIRVPKRPLVATVASTLAAVHEIVELVDYSGNVPKALGFVRVS